MSKLPVTALVLTKNEEASLPGCLRSLEAFAQVLVVDSHSEDDTVAIALQSGAEVVQFDWNGAYPKKKQWSLELEQIRCDWVLFVDADERPDAEFVRWLGRFLDSVPDAIAAADVDLRYRFLGRELKHGHRVVKRALVDRRKCHFPEINDLHVPHMWEVEGHYQPLASGRVAHAAGALRHEDEDPIYDWYSRHNRYSEWEAAARLDSELKRQLRPLRTTQGRVFAQLPFKPLVFFIWSFVIKRGYRDGKSGLLYAAALASYYVMIETKVAERRKRGGVAT